MTVTRPIQRLTARGLCVHFDGIHAVDGVDVDIERGTILGLIGPNGAGKTTAVNALSGFQVPTAGTIQGDDRDVTGKSPQHLAGLGVSRTFQSVRPFARLTVAENVEVAALGAGASRGAARRRAAGLLHRFGLEPAAQLEAAALPAGDERRMGIARALATEPSIVLLDEPAAGLNEAESRDLVDTLREVQAEFELGIVLIEHDMPTVMSLCHRVQVLDYGKTIAEGTPDEVRANRDVVDAYLGVAGA